MIISYASAYLCEIESDISIYEELEGYETVQVLSLLKTSG